nr:gustatory receptor 35 [Papilio memnon]
MKILNHLRLLFVLGNVLLLFRNLSFKSRGTRFFIYCIILIDILISISKGVACLYFKIYQRLYDLLYFIVTLFNSIILIIFSIYHSDNFKKLLIVLNSQTNFIITDEKYLKKFDGKRKILLFAVILYTGMKIVPSIMYSRYYSFSNELPLFVIIIFKINAVFSDARFFYEFIFMCELLYVFSEQMECIIGSVVRQGRFISANFEHSDATLHQLVKSQYIKKVAEWSHAFSHVEEAIKLFNRIFNIQFSIMISSTIFYVTTFVYDTTDLIVNRQINTLILINYLSRVITFHIQIFLLSKAGQRLHNNVEELKRRVGKIFILSLTDDKFYKAAQDLLDHICCDNTRIQAFGSIEVNMSLAPTFIMLYTSYAILALQFNNVL